MKLDNPILMTDAFNLTKAHGLNEEINAIRVSFLLDSEVPVPVFGIGPILETITKKATIESLEEAIMLFGDKRPLMLSKWMDIIYNNNGNLPLRIAAMPEGKFVNGDTVILEIESIDPEFDWLPLYVSPLIRSSLENILGFTSSLLQANLILRDFGKTSPYAFIELTKLFMGSDMYSPNYEMGALYGAYFRVMHPLESSPLGSMLLNRQYSVAPSIFPAVQASIEDSFNRTMEDHLRFLIENNQERILAYSFTTDLKDEVLSLATGELKTAIDERRFPIVFDIVDADESVLVEFAHMLCSVFGSKENEKGFKRIDSDVYVSTHFDSIAALKRYCEALERAKFSIESFSFVMREKAIQKDSAQIHLLNVANPQAQSELPVLFESGSSTPNSPYSFMVEEYRDYMKVNHPEMDTGSFSVLPNRKINGWISGIEGHGVYYDECTACQI